MRGDMSHSSSNTDLDISCHGPQDPNGYGGLQWTPAPLSSMLGGDGVLVGELKASTTSQTQAPPRGSQSPAKQKRRMSRAGSANARPSPVNGGGRGVPPPEQEAGCSARSL
jgi:hypothetical protein